MAGQRCQIDFYGEVGTEAGRKIVEFVVDRKLRSARAKFDGLPEPDRLAKGSSLPVPDVRHALGLALDFRQVSPDREITELGFAAGDQVVQG